MAMVDRDRVIGPASYAPELVALEDLAPAEFIAIAREDFTAIRQRTGATARVGSNWGFTAKGLSSKRRAIRLDSAIGKARLSFG